MLDLRENETPCLAHLQIDALISAVLEELECIARLSQINFGFSLLFGHFEC